MKEKIKAFILYKRVYRNCYPVTVDTYRELSKRNHLLLYQTTKRICGNLFFFQKSKFFTELKSRKKINDFQILILNECILWNKYRLKIFELLFEKSIERTSKCILLKFRIIYDRNTDINLIEKHI